MSDLHLLSRAPSPLTDVSRTPSPCPVAAALPPPTPVGNADPSASKAGVRLPSQSTASGIPSGSSTLSEAAKMHRAKSKAASRAKKRQRLRPEGTRAVGSTKVRSSLARRPMKAIAVPTSFNVALLQRDQWSYIGAWRKRLKAKPWACEELLAIGFERMRWDGFVPHVLCDPEGRIVAYFPGRPRSSGWDRVVEEMTVTLESAELESRRYSTAGLVDRHRGLFLALNTGPSYGGGPKRPGNLQNTAPMQRILDRLLGNWVVQRVAGFGSSIFALYAPKVYAYYEENFEKLRACFPGLKWPFQNSIFPTCTFNLGPATVCLDHVDSTNVPHGWLERGDTVCVGAAR
ncbi:hypothetical protein EWM64_g4744 [Hericium alpestre]|uniref:Uncharacterized protein n=1 Tax=Hericium alpestre TaxID=135208 RepID=A0A4Y9ZYV1_9AGAM|nr:hypothetical protein EWM64_g4744 [Hericium alpestre]